MIFFPAIDLKDGACVRLYKGDMGQATLFSHDPAAQAKSFQDQGAEWLHLVDLNGAFAGKPVNIEAVQAILETTTIPVQLGGGIRDMQTVETWLNAGIRRLILGTIALHQPDFVRQACRAFPQRIVVGIDARGGYVATQGWSEQSKMPATELARKFEDVGVSAIIYTDIERDGAMEGPDIEGTKALAQSVSTPVIASGGIASLEDLKKIRKLAAYGVAGVISGRALYEGAFAVTEAIEALK